ncbi:MAG: outer membrane lipoprotein LolB [Betaproteobacteria bacterium]|nr:outer membrane lipoprotein LolB [Betaproteobacteria bacterium]MDE2621680.1 outer membrane lipoprotein LolB [Betaproteobacteria bacterium]
MKASQALLAALVFLLAGCASWSPTSPPADQVTGHGALRGFRFSGRLAVQQPEGTDTGKIEWSSHGTQVHVDLLSPFGSTVAQLDQTPQHVHLLLSDQREYSAPDAEQLTESVLGYALPLDGLPWWVRGRAAPGDGTARLIPGQDGHPEQLVQAGWLVRYGAWRSVGGEVLPVALSLQRESLTIRLHIDQWTLERGSE